MARQEAFQNLAVDTARVFKLELASKFKAELSRQVKLEPRIKSELFSRQSIPVPEDKTEYFCRVILQ